MVCVAGIVMSANRINAFHLKVAFGIAIQMQSLLLLFLLIYSTYSISSLISFIYAPIAFYRT